MVPSTIYALSYVRYLSVVIIHSLHSRTSHKMCILWHKSPRKRQAISVLIKSYWYFFYTDKHYIILDIIIASPGCWPFVNCYYITAVWSQQGVMYIHWWCPQKAQWLHEKKSTYFAYFGLKTLRKKHIISLWLKCVNASLKVQKKKMFHYFCSSASW